MVTRNGPLSAMANGIKYRRATITAITGLLTFLTGLVWHLTEQYFTARNDPPECIVDRSLYSPPLWLALAGLIYFSSHLG